MSRRLRWGWVLILIGIGQLAKADVLPERRRDQFPSSFGYFVYPIAVQIPGLGSATGGGGTFVNVADSDTDLTAFYIDGDFHAAGLTALNMHLLPRRLILDVGWYEYRVAFRQFERGIDSSPDKYIYPEVEGNGSTGQLTLTFFDRRLDFYSRFGEQANQVNRVFNSDGSSEFLPADKRESTNQLLTLGVNIDLTDDRQDPRRGIRFEANRKQRGKAPEGCRAPLERSGQRAELN